MRLVLDTDVVVAAMRSPAGASAGLLDAAVKGRIRLLGNVALVLEYEAVCLRDEHLQAAGLDRQQVGLFLDGVASLIEPVASRYIWRPQLKDPSDEMVLEAAVNGQAGAIVSFNHRDLGGAPARFGVRLLLPRDAYRRVCP